MGKMQYEMTPSQIWNQLVFWERAFDVERLSKGDAKEEIDEKIKVVAEVNRTRFGTVKGVVKGYLDKNGRQFVDMGGLFGFAAPPAA